MPKRSVLAVALGFLMASMIASTSFAQQDEHEGHHPEGAADTAAPAVPEQKSHDMGEMCHMMQDRMEEMQHKQMEMQSAMHSKLEAMHHAEGDTRMEAMMAAIDEMAADQQAMHEMHTHMMEGMMTHMTEHMAQGMPPAAKKEMMMCPMMGEMKEGMMKDGMMMKGAEGKSGGSDSKAETTPPAEEDHSAHH